MTIGFLRHAEAEDGTGDDFGRRLTPKGREQAARVGAFLQGRGLVPDQILTSPLVRAEQTARIVAGATGCPLAEVGWLASGMRPGAGLKGLEEFSEIPFLVVVGHEPDFSHLIAALIGLPDASALKIRKSSLTVVELAAVAPGCGQLQFSLPVRLMC